MLLSVAAGTVFYSLCLRDALPISLRVSVVFCPHVRTVRRRSGRLPGGAAVLVPPPGRRPPRRRGSEEHTSASSHIGISYAVLSLKKEKHNALALIPPAHRRPPLHC